MNDTILLISALLCAFVQGAWMILFFATAQNKSVILRLAFLLIPCGYFLTLFSIFAGEYIPQPGVFVRDIGMALVTIWLINHNREAMRGCRKLSFWV